MADKYFVILGSPDGGCRIQELTRNELLEGMKTYDDPDELGMRRFGNRRVLDRLPADVDNFDDMVIIKGEIVVPRPKQTVTEYEL